MEAEIKTNIHNRFDIEVRDIKTNVLKQSGIAENIILDRAYTRICNFNTYFNYIHFGSGSGTLSPDRIALFAPISQKTAVDEEKIKEYPVSRITKKIVLAPEEFVGQTITEVGISEYTSQINTHALIKDAEGNPLSILKTDTDVVTIYATVFVELQDANDITFSKFNTNMLIDYFVDGTQMNPSLWIGDIGEPTEMGTIGFKIGEFPITRSVDVANKKTSFSTRLGVDDANYDIRELTLEDICRVNIENTMEWNPLSLTDISIGVGDGERAVFDINRHDITNVVIKVDGNATSDYTLNNIPGNNREGFPLWKLVDTSSPDIDMNIYRGFSAGIAEATGGRPNYVTVVKERIMPVNPDTIVGTILEGSIRGQSSTSSSTGMELKIDGSYDGETYESIASWRVGRTSTPLISQCTINYAYKYLKFTWYNIDANTNYIRGYINYIRYINPDHKRPQIVFNTPPPEGSVITANYITPYIPKTSDYVLDVDFTLQFGEGV